LLNKPSFILIIKSNKTINVEGKIMINSDDQFTEVGINTNSSLFKTFLNADLLNVIDKDFASDIQKFWMNNYNTKVDPLLHMAFMNLTNKKDVRLIPGKILQRDRKSTRLNSSHVSISYAVFCLKK